MSTTAEMSQCCTEVLIEADSSSSRSVSPAPAVTITPTLSECQSPSLKHLCVNPPLAQLSSGCELRRHSTPAQSKTRTPASGRRSTTIPLTQEEDDSLSGKVFFIGSPPDSPPRQASATPSSDSGSGSGGYVEPRKSIDSVSLPGTKRDYSDSTREKSFKMLKLMKENVDPRSGGFEDVPGKGLLTATNRKSNNQV